MERETNSIRIKRFSFSNDLLKLPNVARKFSRIRLAKRHIRVKHPFEGKDHIFGVEIARGFKPTRDFNAEDVVFTFERMLNPNMPFSKAYTAEFPSYIRE